MLPCSGLAAGKTGAGSGAAWGLWNGKKKCVLTTIDDRTALNTVKKRDFIFCGSILWALSQ